MTCPFSSPLSVNKWVCGSGAQDINGDLCCGNALLPRSKRTNEFQAMVQVIEATIALGQQGQDRGALSIVLAAQELHPEETDITTDLLLDAVDKASRNGLFCVEGLQYSVNAHNSATRVHLYPYFPFVQAFSPFKVKYPPLLTNIEPI